jgi:hypothetical protein
MIRYHSGSLQYVFSWRGKRRTTSFGGNQDKMTLTAAHVYMEEIKKIREQCRLNKIPLPADPPKPVKPPTLKQLINRHAMLIAENNR